MKLAAVVYDPGEAKAIDALFCGIAEALKAEGYRLAGAVQRNESRSGNACAHMVLEDIASGRAFDISVPGEKKSAACSLDPAALEDVAGHVAATLDGAVDLVLINRFGKQEVLGHGLRAVIETAIAAELPVLVALCNAHRESFDAFAGGDAEVLTPDARTLLDWCRNALNGPAHEAGMRALAPAAAG